MTKTALLLTALVIGVTITILALMGRTPFCQCGTIKLWSSNISSNENSQQLADAYSFSHVIHGILFYALLQVLFKKRFPAAIHFALPLAIIIESVWEILENSPIIINRYRETTISLGYYGDSIFNTTGDLLACVLGFWLASKLPTWVSVALIVTIELAMLYLIRDNLTLNIIQLIHPFPGITAWQVG
jgi:hypothetical protein